VEKTALRTAFYCLPRPQMKQNERLLFDTSVFSYIHEHDLYSEIEAFFKQNKDTHVYVTPTQIDELSAICDISKRNRINSFMQTISVKNIAAGKTYYVYYLSSERDKRSWD
jgi:hypothetical protein